MNDPADLHPHLLYRAEAGEARFATWRLVEGHEALALFTTVEAAEQYRAGLTDQTSWSVYQPTRNQLIEVLRAGNGAGIRYAALDPINGSAKTLFDVPQVLAAADQQAG